MIHLSCFIATELKYTLVGEQINPHKNPTKSLRRLLRPRLKRPSVEMKQDSDWWECLQGLARRIFSLFCRNPFHWLSECWACGRLIKDALTSPFFTRENIPQCHISSKEKKETHIYGTLKVAMGRW